jgi:hypothetical protein
MISTSSGNRSALAGEVSRQLNAGGAAKGRPARHSFRPTARDRPVWVVSRRLQSNKLMVCFGGDSGRREQDFQFLRIDVGFQTVSGRSTDGECGCASVRNRPTAVAGAPCNRDAKPSRKNGQKVITP